MQNGITPCGFGDFLEDIAVAPRALVVDAADRVLVAHFDAGSNHPVTAGHPHKPQDVFTAAHVMILLCIVQFCTVQCSHSAMNVSHNIAQQSRVSTGVCVSTHSTVDIPIHFLLHFRIPTLHCVEIQVCITVVIALEQQTSALATELYRIENTDEYMCT